MFKQFGKSHFIINKLDRSLFKMPRRNMSDNNPLNMLPTVTKRIVIANTFFFGLGLFMNNRQYITEFFYNKYALRHNKYHVLITSHFAKANFLDYLLETFITGLLGAQLEQMMGTQSFMRLIGASIGFASVLLLTMHKEDSFFKSEAVLRGILWYFVLSNPQQSFFIFPLPIQVKALWLGVFIGVMDYLSHRWANFGGFFAALLLTRRLI
jgi:membrane associated rhomboid family serine protease